MRGTVELFQYLNLGLYTLVAVSRFCTGDDTATRPGCGLRSASARAAGERLAEVTIDVDPRLVAECRSCSSGFTRSADTRRWLGTGVGLAIARSCAQAHRGDLLYEPAVPSGARFQLVLPRR